jgi:hypothetical protein
MTSTTPQVEPAGPPAAEPPPRPAARSPRRARRPAGPERREQRLFLAAISVVGLHVVDDSFLQPQPGTSAGDHSRQRLRAAGGAGAGRGGLLAPAGRWSCGGRSGGRLFRDRVWRRGRELHGAGRPVGRRLHRGPFHARRDRAARARVHNAVADPPATGQPAAPLAAAGHDRRRWSRRRFLHLYPLGYAYVGTHVARPPVDDIELGSTNVEDVELHTSDGLTLKGSYVPPRNGAA